MLTDRERFKVAGQSERRLPKAIRFKGDAMSIKNSGSAVALIPITNSWASLFASRDKFTKDVFGREEPTRAATARDDIP